MNRASAMPHHEVDASGEHVAVLGPTIYERTYKRTLGHDESVVRSKVVENFSY